jgi:hypothetical protein
MIHGAAPPPLAPPFLRALQAISLCRRCVMRRGARRYNRCVDALHGDEKLIVEEKKRAAQRKKLWANALQESELVMLARAGAVEEIVVKWRNGGYELHVKLKEEAGMRFLCTRRSRSQVRLFKRLNGVVKNIKLYYDVNFPVRLDLSELPSADAVR